MSEPEVTSFAPDAFAWISSNRLTFRGELTAEKSRVSFPENSLSWSSPQPSSKM